LPDIITEIRLKGYCFVRLKGYCFVRLKGYCFVRLKGYCFVRLKAQGILSRDIVEAQGILLNCSIDIP
jgi:hypothetical protein